MSNTGKRITRIHLHFDGINTREAVDRVEKGLHQIEGLEVEDVGLNTATIAYDLRQGVMQEVEAVIAGAGGYIRHSHEMD